MSGEKVFSLVDGTVARRATRRERANRALIRHRQKPVPMNVQKSTLDVWTKYLMWRLEWENAIYRYRDGNNNGKDNDDD